MPAASEAPEAKKDAPADAVMSDDGEGEGSAKRSKLRTAQGSNYNPSDYHARVRGAEHFQMGSTQGSLRMLMHITTDTRSLPHAWHAYALA